MAIDSLEYKTECIFASFDGDVIEREGYTVLRTPSNPNYHWGNFLVFDRSPSPGDVGAWISRFIEEIAAKQVTGHVLFGWNVTASSEDEAVGIAAFEEAGMAFEASPLMSAPTLHAPQYMHQDIDVRPLRTDDEWEAATTLQIASRNQAFGLESYTRFKRAQMIKYRAMAEAGVGQWYGAFLGESLVADLGIYHNNEGLARYQSVETRADMRRQGICGRLVFESARLFERTYGSIEQWVIVSEATGAAARVYQRVGFRTQQMSPSLTWWSGMNDVALLDAHTID